MSSPALSSSPRVLVMDEDRSHDVFDVLGAVDGDSIVRVRSPFLFEVGEEFPIRIEQDGTVYDALARVRAHVGPDDARITELEISDRSDPRPLGTER